MGRRRAGHGWTCRFRKDKSPIHFLFSAIQGWITTGEAQGWPRCRLDVKEFWRLHEEGYYLAPYRIGERVTATQHKDNQLLTRSERKAA